MINYPTNQTEFEIGSYVLAEYKNTFRRGPQSKLMPFLKGPFQIMNKEKSKYFLKDLITQKIKPYHVKRLTQFNLDVSKWDPLNVALRDTGDLFQVEHISAMKGNPRGKKSQLFFKVHWLGYDDNQATYEPWANVRSNRRLHEFLRTHSNPAVRGLLPAQYNETNTPISDSESEDDLDS